jgi:superfamily II DNA or RNA helicase
LDEGADVEGLNLAIILSNTSSQTQKTQRVKILNGSTAQ